MIRGRLRRHREPRAEGPATEYIEIDPGQLTGIIRVPQWLRDAGMLSWLLLGIGLLVVSLVFLMGLMQVIVAPLITAGVVAAVASPLVRKMNGIGIPRGVGAALVLLGIILLGAGVVVMIVNGITGEASSISTQLSSAKDTLGGWLEDLGLDPSHADSAKAAASHGVADSKDALLNGLAVGIDKLSSLGFFLALTTLSLFFLLKDGPVIRGWAEGHLALPTPVSRTITQRTLESLRGYFLGVTIVALFNVVVVSLGCVLLGVPLIGTIAAVTFVGAYVPYLGAWSAAGFAVLIALGNEGPEAAAGMIVVELLANGILQQMVQPLAMGAALGIHPLAVLVVTIGGGALFGAAGLILAAPLTSAIVRISADITRAKAELESESPHLDDAAQAAPA